MADGLMAAIFDFRYNILHVTDFYPNVIRSGLCRRKSARLSVTFVRPTQGVETFGQYFFPLCTLAIF